MRGEVEEDSHGGDQGKRIIVRTIELPVVIRQYLSRRLKTKERSKGSRERDVQVSALGDKDANEIECFVVSETHGEGSSCIFGGTGVEAGNVCGETAEVRWTR